MAEQQGKKWYQKVPNAYVLLFYIIVLVAILTYIIPAGSFEYEEVIPPKISSRSKPKIPVSYTNLICKSHIL